MRNVAAFHATAVLAIGLLAGCENPGTAPEAPVAIEELASPAAPGSAEPQLATDAAGRAVLSWIEPSGDGHALKHSTLDLDARQWDTPRIAAAGDDWYVNPMDLPSVQPITADLWAAHWLVASAASPFAYDIAVATSQDGGASFGDPALLNDDGTAAEHGFVTLFPWGGAVGAVWLDGRELAQFHEQEPTAPELEVQPVGTNLRFARLTADGAVVEQGLIDRLVCDCCQTDVALTARGPLVVYRDRTDGEIRDIVIRSHGGSGWSDPVRLAPDNWQIEGCPVNGPAIAARGATVVIAWFTAAGDQPRVRVVRSTDQGRRFAAPIDVDTDGSFGQVDVVLAGDDSAVVSWWRRNPSGGTQLAARRISAGGALGAVQVVATSPASRPLDVPQMAATGEHVVFAWTQSGEHSLVRTLLADF